jgi:hypothetical protein
MHGAASVRAWSMAPTAVPPEHLDLHLHSLRRRESTPRPSSSEGYLFVAIEGQQLPHVVYAHDRGRLFIVCDLLRVDERQPRS